MYLYNWSEKKDLAYDFAIDVTTLDGCEVILAAYEYEDYSGTAYVLYSKEGKLYEAHGSHCSCYGLEEQWKPEETSYEDLQFRLEKGTLGLDSWSNDMFKSHLTGIIKNKEFNDKFKKLIEE